MIRLLSVFFIFIIATLLHWFFIEIFSPLSITVGVMFAFSLVMARALPEPGGYTFAFISGLFLDFFGNVLFGGYALVFTIMMFIFYKIDDKIDFKEVGPQLVITTFLNLIAVILYGLFGKIFTGSFLWHGFRSLLVGSLITGLLLPVVYLAVTKYLMFGPAKKTNGTKTIF